MVNRSTSKAPTPKKPIQLLVVLVVAVLVGLFGWASQRQALDSRGPNESEVLVRFESPQTLAKALERLQLKGVVHDANTLSFWARVQRPPGMVRSGTYRFSPHITGRAVLKALSQPIRQMVRLPETNWARRNANLLEQAGVCTAEEYMALVKKPGEFEGLVSFPLPESSLEGYLYPDTYDLPPLLGARGVIERQLRAFESKVWKALGEPKNLHRAVTIASMLELEAKLDEEKPTIAGVIENRMRIGMRLQIDATVNYGMQVWRPLLRRDYREVDSPFNTYRVDGLPAGPICSPTVVSIRAALDPEEHSYLYYVAMPAGHHLFARDFDAHRANIQRRRNALSQHKEDQRES